VALLENELKIRIVAESDDPAQSAAESIRQCLAARDKVTSVNTGAIAPSWSSSSAPDAVADSSAVGWTTPAGSKVIKVCLDLRFI
jgi:hypothetical protein